MDASNSPFFTRRNDKQTDSKLKNYTSFFPHVDNVELCLSDSLRSTQEEEVGGRVADPTFYTQPSELTTVKAQTHEQQTAHSQML